MEIEKLKMLSIRESVVDALTEIARETRRKAGPLAEEILVEWIAARKKEKEQKNG